MKQSPTQQAIIIPCDEISGAKELFEAINQSFIYSSLQTSSIGSFEDHLDAVKRNLDLRSKAVFPQRIMRLQIELATFELYDFAFQRAVEISSYCKDLVPIVVQYVLISYFHSFQPDSPKFSDCLSTLRKEHGRLVRKVIGSSTITSLMRDSIISPQFEVAEDIPKVG